MPTIADSSDGFVLIAPEIANAPTILRDRNDESKNAGPDKRQPKDPWRSRKLGRFDSRRFVEPIQNLKDGEAEADQCYSRSHPRHKRAFRAHACAQPREMAIRRGSHIESIGLLIRSTISHGNGPASLGNDTPDAPAASEFRQP